MKVAVIIVSYNSAPTLQATLESVFQQQGAPFEVILVDNASRDESLDIARNFIPRGLKIIANQQNRGFAGGNNDGVAASTGELLWLINPDVTMPGTDLILRLIETFTDEPNLGIVGCKMFAADGRRLLHCGGLIGRPAHTSMIGRGELDEGQYDQPREVEWVEGSAMALRRSLWDELRGFDEDYFPAYYEDTDLCARARRHGYRVTYLPTLALIHREKQQAETHDPQFWRMIQTSRVLYTLKNESLAGLLLRALPAEWRWFWHRDMYYLRRGVLRAYLNVAKLYVGKLIGRGPGPPPRGGGRS